MKVFMTQDIQGTLKMKQINIKLWGNEQSCEDTWSCTESAAWDTR